MGGAGGEGVGKEMQGRRGGGVICVCVLACIRASDRQYFPTHIVKTSVLDYQS